MEEYRETPKLTPLKTQLTSSSTVPLEDEYCDLQTPKTPKFRLPSPLTSTGVSVVFGGVEQVGSIPF